MIIQRLHVLAIAILLSSLPGCSRANPDEESDQSFPVRSLLAELPTTAQPAPGSAAYIHTSFKTGLGVLIREKNEVITARHNVLSPTGHIAEEIVVGISPQPSSIAIVDTPSTVTAQDPVNDIVLLKLHPLPQASPVAAATPFPMVPIPSASSAPVVQEHRSAKSPQLNTATDDNPVSRRGTTPRASSSTRGNSKLRIVYDGPLPGRR